MNRIEPAARLTVKGASGFSPVEVSRCTSILNRGSSRTSFFSSIVIRDEHLVGKVQYFVLTEQESLSTLGHTDFRLTPGHYRKTHK